MNSSAAAIKVLLAIDTSETAQYAVRLLLQLQPAWQVTMLHVVDVETQPHPHLSGGLLQEYHERLRQHLRNQADQFVSRIGKQLSKCLTQVQTIVRDGIAADIILTEAHARQVDLIMLGSRGLSTIPALLLGSVSYRVMHHARCSVLLMKQPVSELGTMVLGLDRSPGAREAAIFARESGLVAMAKRTIVATVNPSRSLPGAADSERETSWRDAHGAATTFVQRTQRRFAAQGYSVEGIVLEGDPAAALLELAQQESVDLVVVGTRGRTGVRRLLLGSISQKLTMHATCAVLTVRHPPWKIRASRPGSTPTPEKT